MGNADQDLERVILTNAAHWLGIAELELVNDLDHDGSCNSTNIG